MIRPPPRSPLFPYPTLFPSPDRPSRAGGRPRAAPSVDGEPPGRASLADDQPGRITTRRRGSSPSDVVFTPSISATTSRSEEHTSELQSRLHIVCRLLLAKKHPRLTSSALSAAHSHVTEPARANASRSLVAVAPSANESSILERGNTALENVSSIGHASEL